MADFRKERDLLGEMNVPAGALHGIYTERAMENFPLAGRAVRAELIGAYGAVKLACARTNRELDCFDGPAADAVERACAEMMEGRLDAHVRADALQGGAGTSTNMNINATQNCDAFVEVSGILNRLCVAGIQADRDRCRRHVHGSTAMLTALVERIGYEQTQAVAESARREGASVRDIVIGCRLMNAEEFDSLVSAEAVMRLGSAGKSDAGTQKAPRERGDQTL